MEGLWLGKEGLCALHATGCRFIPGYVKSPWMEGDENEQTLKPWKAVASLSRQDQPVWTIFRIRIRARRWQKACHTHTHTHVHPVSLSRRHLHRFSPAFTPSAVLHSSVDTCKKNESEPGRRARLASCLGGLQWWSLGRETLAFTTKRLSLASATLGSSCQRLQGAVQSLNSGLCCLGPAAGPSASTSRL